MRQAGRIGQGATEYLVLLAVVLVIALVGIALLGFFPGTASEAQMSESQIYWRSANPIAITEWGARAYVASGATYPYLRVRNTGTYPIRITGIVGGDGAKATTFWTNLVNPASCPSATDSGGSRNIRDYYYMAPGEEKYFAWGGAYGLPCEYQINVRTSGSSGFYVGGATSICQNSTSSPGFVEAEMGFEYEQYVEGQTITKRQLGVKPVIIKCREPA